MRESRHDLIRDKNRTALTSCFQTQHAEQMQALTYDLPFKRNLDLASPLRNRIDLDTRSGVSNPGPVFLRGLILSIYSMYL